MNTLDITTKLLSDAAWRKIFESTAESLVVSKEDFVAKIHSLEKLRNEADFNTGSITLATAWTLYSISCHFHPTYVLEIGTFIGKSALSMALGSDDASVETEVHTCDKSNNITLPTLSRSRIIQYQKQSSTEMLSKIKNDRNDVQFDMLHADGKIVDDDFDLLRKMLSDDAVIVLDDFDENKKGVKNFTNLRDKGLLDNYVLIGPPSDVLLKELGFIDGSTTALLVPVSRLRYRSVTNKWQYFSIDRDSIGLFDA